MLTVTIVRGKTLNRKKPAKLARKTADKPRHLRIIKAEIDAPVEPLKDELPRRARPLLNFLTQLADSLEREVERFSGS